MTDAAPEQSLRNPKAKAISLGLLLLLAAVTGYELLLVGLDTYGYSLSRRSSHMVFFNAFLLAALVLVLYRLYLRTIRRSRILRAEGWMAVSLVGGLLALYWAWVVDRWLRLGPMGGGKTGFSLSPAALADYVTEFHEKGLWGFGIAWYYDHNPVRGGWLLVWWLLEASMLLLLPSALTWRFLARHPQCADCGSWIERKIGVRRLQSSRAPVVQAALRSGDLDALEEPDRPQKGDPFTLRIDLSKCETCPDAVYLSLVQDKAVLLWMQRIPMSQLQKVFKSVRSGPGVKSAQNRPGIAPPPS
jgi:hypothetical protein